MAYPNNPSSPTDLLSAIPEKFDVARKSGELFFFPSQAKDVYSQGRRFNLRLCPALQDKAKAKADALASVQAENNGSPDRKRARTDSSSDNNNNKVKQNEKEPFRPPYVPELYVGCMEGLDGEEGMSVLVSLAYSLLPEHILLCSLSPQPQSLPPTPPQLVLAYNLIQAASRHPTRPKRLLGFYNGGEGAGASQSWRHFQVIEVPGGRAPVEEWVQGVQVDRLDQAVLLPNVPYLHIIHPLPPSHSVQYPPTAESNDQLIDFLAPALMRMLDLAFDALRSGSGGSGSDSGSNRKEGGWNLLMTLDHLHLIPRSLPSFPLSTETTNTKEGPQLELNSLGYAGMMLVRSEQEESNLLAQVEGKGGLMYVLEKCGVPRSWGEKAKENEGVQQGSGDLMDVL
ncbi:hypothetical protein I316_05193 [Kwoniella heveanensis BCC8398]|uniref:Uncharacterized protein n=1 Tax=Kwoniella heveanensis BCC8398 TaxID=1296120 RepID=A0A1B9GQ81_9TREE|nr:hypothetical protein I316_05193 [Kwoniella heveanensis BCC8398]